MKNFQNLPMLHSGLMQVETALFFESTQQIYARVFASVKPRTPIPQIRIEFKQYANANSRITLKNGVSLIQISDLLQSASSPVQEALANILIPALSEGS